MVIGSGIAGLVAALTVPPRVRVAVITKGALDDGCTRWAQGGIAVALDAGDSPQRHFDDTVAAGRGLCDELAVRVLVEDGPARVRQLIEWGVRFDTHEGALMAGREAAHSRPRVLHAGGDSTGREIESALIRRLVHSSVHVAEHTTVTSLLHDASGRCAGVACSRPDGAEEVISAGAVILAMGGAGRLWRNTTNPVTATGDGVALAYAAGAEVANLEFEQFHPTALALRGAPQFLISEALRGEGAQIVNRKRERFLFDADPRGELAGRDIVARAIWEELQRSGEDHVLLDCSPLRDRVRERFPTISRACKTHGIDIGDEPVPVAPAAHYLIGGVRTDIDGATSVPGLFACGEVASTGVHGANRLASNSLLEGAVFGHRAARGALADIAERPISPVIPPPAPLHPDRAANWHAAGRQLSAAMWDGCGLVRDATGLQRALAITLEVKAACMDSSSLDALRVARSASVAELICRAALAREETRGAHVRSDFPETSDSWQATSVVHKERHHCDSNA